MMPIMPNGAKLIIQRTTMDTAFDKSCSTVNVTGLAIFLTAKPKNAAHTRMPI